MTEDPEAPPTIGIVSSPGRVEEASILRRALGLAPLDPGVTPEVLVRLDERVEVVWREEAGSSRSRPIAVDLVALDTRSRAGRSRGQPIARAVGLHRGERPVVVDASAGYGEDTWLLASLGCRVIAVERHPLVAMLLADGLRRAALTEPEVASRIQLRRGNARQVLPSLEPRPDVVYLDPMFPRRRGSALERKPLRLLRRIVGDDDDAGQVFELAFEVAVRRVVVKRPLRGAPLAPGPTSRQVGKSLRYDVYARPPESPHR